MITIKINTSNEVFHDENGVSNNFLRNMETVRILEDLAKKIEESPNVEWYAVPLLDLNGNVVGSFCYDPTN